MSAASVSKTNPAQPRRAEARSSERPSEHRPVSPDSRVVVRAGDEDFEPPPPSLIPDLREQVELDEGELTAYLSHLSREGGCLEVRVKDGPAAVYRQLARLPELHRLLLEKRLWGAQVMHRTAGIKVVDSLIVQQSGILRVRTRV